MSEEPRITGRLFIRNKDNKVLLLHKDNSSVAADMWEGPGGNINEGEGILDGLLRETKSETGLTIDPANVEFRGVFKYKPKPEYADRIVNQFDARIDTDGREVVVGTDPDDKHDKFDWFSDDEVKRMISEGKLLGNSLHYNKDLSRNI